ncbi:hypothetical protein [Dehalogenimonas sp. 4OHTPN]|uniref:Uncharacterized protein n=1 Tax=Dehalogenimonas sp. 4OHTPN TaxID=3166643 RepID=A0AAU8GB69_9CHLR
MVNSEERDYGTRQERRERRRAAKGSKMTHHGKSIALIYRQSVERRAGEKKSSR